MSWHDRLRAALGVHSEEEIAAAVEAEPTIQAARRQLARADRILRELELVEQGPRRARTARRPGGPL